MNTIMSVDVEAIGLYGPAFWVGWVLFDKGIEIESGYYACNPVAMLTEPGNDWDWVKANIPKPVGGYNRQWPIGVRLGFWQSYMELIDRYTDLIVVADCPFPVETRFFEQCINDAPMERRPYAPYPLVDVASIGLALGFDPMVEHTRALDELPRHDPVNDARQSGRQLIRYLQSIRK